MNDSKITMSGEEICFIVKPSSSDNMLVYRTESDALDIADRLSFETGTDYMVFPSYLDPKIVSY